MSSSANITGYGPHNAGYLMFDSKNGDFVLWEMRLLAHLRGKKLNSVLESDAESTTSSHDAKNLQMYDILTTLLDDFCLRLIRCIPAGDGKAALVHLRSHFVGSGKSQMYSLVSKLCYNKKGKEESVTSFLLRTEEMYLSMKTAVTTLEEFMEDLMVGSILNALSYDSDFRTFSAIFTQSGERRTFTELKSGLKIYEQGNKTRQQETISDDVLAVKSRPTCFTCNKPGHFSKSCPEKRNKWCRICRNSSHITKNCRRKSNANFVDADEDNLSTNELFLASSATSDDSHRNPADRCSLLVDCGATTHIINDRNAFESFDGDFDASKHAVQLADGSRTSGIVSGRGTANIGLTDAEGKSRVIKLENALYIPSFPQNILSVQASVRRGASYTFDESPRVLMNGICLLYTSPSPRDKRQSRMPSSA